MQIHTYNIQQPIKRKINKNNLNICTEMWNGWNLNEIKYSLIKTVAGRVADL